MAIFGKGFTITICRVPSFTKACGAMRALLPNCEAFAKVKTNTSRGEEVFTVE